MYYETFNAVIHIDKYVDNANKSLLDKLAHL